MDQLIPKSLDWWEEKNAPQFDLLPNIPHTSRTKGS